MPITDVLTAASVFVAMVGAVRAVAITRIRGALGKERRMRGKTIAIGLVLLLGPAIRASAAEPAASGADRRKAVAPAPDVELKALEDTLTFDQRWFARPNDTAAALTPSAEGRSSVAAELDALTAATMAENSARGPTSGALARGNGLGGDAPAAETNPVERNGTTSQSTPAAASHQTKGDEAIGDAHDDASSGAAGAAPVSQDVLGSDAHDDSGLSPGGAFDAKLGAPADDESGRFSRSA
jgi:hypothetical protein